MDILWYHDTLCYHVRDLQAFDGTPRILCGIMLETDKHLVELSGCFVLSC
jgi:hypothetical protein